MSESKKWYQRWYVWLIIIALFGSILSKDENKEKQVATNNENIEESSLNKEKNDALEIKSSTLYKAYESNEISADNKFKDKWVKLTGKIIDIRKNPIKKSESIVKLNGLIDNKYEIVGVSCHFDESQNSEISKLVEGQIITILGKCLGKPVFIKIADCSIENVNPLQTGDKNSYIKPETKTVANSKPIVKKKAISGLYMWNDLAYGNFAIFNKDGSCSFGLVEKSGLTNSRTEGQYKVNGSIITVSGLYNPNWEGAAKNNGDWKIIGASTIEKSENSLGYRWFKKSRFRDRGLKIEF